MHIHSLRYFSALAIVVLFIGVATGAHATVTISSASTKNVVCSSGVCTATRNISVLNVSDLQNMLASGNVKVVTAATDHLTGDIKIAATLTWVSTNTLTLDAYHSIIVTRPVTVAGSGGLTLLTNDGGTGGGLSFDNKGKIDFWSLSSNLTINGNAYTLVNNIATLASDVTANQTGFYALAGNYNAGADGTYSKSPIPDFFGVFEGLGNTISNFTLDASTKNNQSAGLFSTINSSTENAGLISAENVNLINVNVKGGRRLDIGGLAGDNVGVLSRIFVSGQVIGGGGSATGALVGDNAGTIVNSHTTARVRAITSSCIFSQRECYLGGFVGLNVEIGTISNSYATGSVSGAQFGGGLAGGNYGAINNSYATGAVSGGHDARVGGLVGVNAGFPQNNATISDSYSTGSVVGGDSSIIGGFIGIDGSTSGSITNSYWDTTTSGIANSSQGAGNISNDPGITGLTTIQLRAGLPTGFAPSIWAESATINSGLPYLLDIPPP